MMTMRSVFVVLSQPPVQPAEEENEEGDEDKDNDGDGDEDDDQDIYDDGQNEDSEDKI